MPIAPTFPGVYIQEIPSGVRTITGVSTSVTAFIDFYARGPLSQAVQIFSMADFDRIFGGLDSRSEASYAIKQFYLNGGATAWVVRCAAAGDNGLPSAQPAEIVLLGGDSSEALRLQAASPGVWGNRLQARTVQVGVGSFDLSISELADDGRVLNQEVFRGLTAAAGRRNVATVINDESQLVRVVAPTTTLPLTTGTISTIGEEFPDLPGDVERTVNVTIDGVVGVARLGREEIPDLHAARNRLQSGIRAAVLNNPSFGRATVEIFQPDPAEPAQLRVLAGRGQPGVRVVFENASDDDTTAEDLGLTGSTANVQAYTPGPAINGTGQGAGAQGLDGTQPGATELIAALSALDRVDFNLLCIPRMADLAIDDGASVIGEAARSCEERRAFLLVDPPSAINGVQEITDWLSDNATLRSRNAALYFPRLSITDPLNENRRRSIAASGTMAGVYARTDADRGVWKAPAGVDATLRGVRALEFQANDAETGALNPLAINMLRNLQIFGIVAWGARTLRGADQLADEYKYIPVRRTALFIEESLYRGLHWVVFEPNDEPLWAQIRLNVGAFMHNLFRQGAFQGRTPREAYLVRCDRETTTQNDINLGIVNILVGFAPLKPAEFVIISIQQLAGQIEV